MSTQEESSKGKYNGKYLTFHLGTEKYGIRVEAVKEIIGIIPINSVPEVPDFVKGVINLRGRVIPIYELRMVFRMGSIDQDEKTCIIIVETKTENQDQVSLKGIIVDSVSEVSNIRNQAVEDAKKALTTDIGYINGFAKEESGSVIVLLDINMALCQ